MLYLFPYFFIYLFKYLFISLFFLFIYIFIFIFIQRYLIYYFLKWIVGINLICFAIKLKISKFPKILDEISNFYGILAIQGFFNVVNFSENYCFGILIDPPFFFPKVGASGLRFIFFFIPGIF